MGKQIFGRMNKILSLLLLVLFVVSVTAISASASTQDYKDGCKAGYKAGYTAGEEKVMPMAMQMDPKQRERLLTVKAILAMKRSPLTAKTIEEVTKPVILRVKNKVTRKAMMRVLKTELIVFKDVKKN